MISKILQNTWSIFLGMLFLMLGNGLQGTLISWRATFEGFSASTTGWVMTGYYIGFLAGSLLTPRLVKGVGHIRVFAALASLASTAVLIQIIWISADVWLLMRMLTGFCFAGAYVIAESWLNARSNNQTRGQVLSIYMIVSFVGMAAGQWLLKLSDPAGFVLFVSVSILLSLALVPVLISRIQAPDIELSQESSIKDLFGMVPSGVLSILFSAVAHSSMFGMGAVFAVKSGMDIESTIHFMSAFIVLGALGQWPIGWLSDRMDRRILIVTLSVITTLLCVYMYHANLSHTELIILFAITGAVTLPIYSLGVAYTNDRLEPEQMVGASSSIILLLGSGSILGPVTAGWILDLMGTSGFFIHIGAMHVLMIVGVGYFLMQNAPVDPEHTTQYQTIPPRATSVAMEAIAQEAEELQLAHSDPEETLQ